MPLVCITPTCSPSIIVYLWIWYSYNYYMGMLLCSTGIIVVGQEQLSRLVLQVLLWILAIHTNPFHQGCRARQELSITGTGPLINPSYLYHPVPPRLHSRMQSVIKQTNTTGQHYAHIRVDQEPSPPNEPTPGQAEIAQEPWTWCIWTASMPITIPCT
ncbi:hypothetical protein BDQ17DRAFT_1325643 [Cyathus striatus]|nr:hypothetical protein BDQ17DRAFT_1325643 [Cyathus striatus]